MDRPITIKIPSELFALAESSSFEGEYELPMLSAGPDDYTCDGPVSWQVTVTNTGEALLVTGTAEGDAHTACGRCLRDVDMHLEGEIEGYFLLEDDAAIPDEMEGDEYELLPADHVIDMRPLIEAALLVEVPYMPLCKEDCAGLCPTCGADLNEGPCGCVSDEPETDNPFAVLKGLKLE